MTAKETPDSGDIERLVDESEVDTTTHMELDTLNMPSIESYGLPANLPEFYICRMENVLNSETVSPGTTADSSRRGLYVIYERLARINMVRNRAAHHEHLFSSIGSDCLTLRSCRDAVALFSQLEPKACGYVYEDAESSCSVDQYLEKIPAPCRVVV